jgi:hypothetical protein
MTQTHIVQFNRNINFSCQRLGSVLLGTLAGFINSMLLLDLFDAFSLDIRRNMWFMNVSCSARNYLETVFTG